MGTSFKRSHAWTAAFSVPNPAAGHHQPTPPLDTTEDSQASLGQSLVRSKLLSPGSCCAQVFVCLTKSLFPQSCVNSVINSHQPPKSNSLGFSGPLPELQVGKYIVGHRILQEFIWYNCFAAYRSSAWRLYGGVNRDFLRQGLCHMLCDSGLMHPEPLPLKQATADLYLCKRHSNTQRQIWLHLQDHPQRNKCKKAK